MKEINNEEQIKYLSSQLVEFLSELHFQPISNLDIKKQSVEDIHQSIVELYDIFRDKLFPYMNEK
jgi:aminoglycoside 2''-phosphotransferase